MTFKEVWKKHLESCFKNRKLWDEGWKLCLDAEKLRDENYTLDAEGKRLLDEGIKLQNKSYKLHDENAEIFYNSLQENYGKKIRTVLYEHERRVLSNGVILYYNGNIYEPLEVVMKRIIKKHEEEEE